MTVLTKVKVSKKEDEPAQTHLVDDRSEDHLEKGLAADAATGEDEVDADAVRYMVLSQRARRVNGSSICVLTGILLTFSACLLFGLFYYRQSHQAERLHAWCSVPFEVEQPTLPPSDVELLFDSPLGSQPRRDPEPLQKMQPVFHEEFDIDFEADTESMFVPKFELGQGAHFLNDFTFSQMVIMPEEPDTIRVCMVTELDETMFLEPQPLAERVRRMEEGLDESPMEVTRETFSIRFPAMTEGISPNIQRACSGLSIFALERRNVFKRSAEKEAADSAGKFAVFGGRGVVQFVITNMSELQ